MRRYTPQRSWYIPKSYTAKVTGKGIQAEIYLVDGMRGPEAIAFGGKRSKPDFHIRFHNEERRAEHVAKYLANMKARADEKKERQAKANAFEHTLKVGDILYSSWGYDQTNIDFYQVTKLVGKKSAWIRQLAGMVDHHDGCQSNYVVANEDTFKKGSKAMLKRVREGNNISLNSYSSAHPWDGQALRETDAYSGH